PAGLRAAPRGGGGASAGVRHRTALRLTGRVGPISAVAARQTPTRGAGSRVANPDIYAPEAEVQEPEGGRAVRSGDVAAPTASQHADVAGSQAPGLTQSWEGSNHFDSRYSNNGNQFSGEPPDQGLCTSGSRVFEIV